MGLRVAEGYEEDSLSGHWDSMRDRFSGDFSADYSLTPEWGDCFAREKFVTKIARYTLIDGSREVGFFQGVVKGNPLYHYLISGYTSGGGMTVLPEYYMEAGGFLSEVLRLEKVQDYDVYLNFPLVLPERASKSYFTYYVDLGKTSEEIMNGMEKNSRRLLKRGINNGLSVEVSKSPDSVRGLYDFLEGHSVERGYKIPSLDWYLEMMESFNRVGDFVLVTARSGSDILSACVCLGYDRRINFLNCANVKEGNSLGANRLCHFKLFEWARDHGYSVCDLGGTDKVKLSGIDHFKKSFGGYEVERSLLSSNTSNVAQIYSQLSKLSRLFSGS